MMAKIASTLFPLIMQEWKKNVICVFVKCKICFDQSHYAECKFNILTEVHSFQRMNELYCVALVYAIRFQKNINQQFQSVYYTRFVDAKLEKIIAAITNHS